MNKEVNKEMLEARNKFIDQLMQVRKPEPEGVKCNECDYKTSDLAVETFLCIDCQKKKEKPISLGVLILVGVLAIFVIEYFNMNLQGFILGLGLGALGILAWLGRKHE
jgi:hypothetical protein